MERTARIAGALLLLAGAFALGLGVTSARNGEPSSRASSAHDVPRRLIDEVRLELATAYYREIPAAVLERKRIDHVLAGLDDPYTDYLTPHEYGALRNRTARSYSGVGITVRPGSRGLVVKAALEGPARAAGIRKGDRIVMIGRTSVDRLPLDRSLELIKGREGTTVKLTVQRPREGTMTFVVRRTSIALPAVRSRMLGDRRKVGYVRVLTFRANATEEVARRASRLVRRGARGIVLDLRGSPGGLLSQAVGTVSLFLEDGIVCVTEGENTGRRVYEVTGEAPLADVPLAVLVDRGSASAAEIVAAALGDQNRAVVVGGSTYGKGFVQSVRELSNGAALKLTTAVFVTPDGDDLSGRGYPPHVRAADRPETARDEALDRAAAVVRES